MTKRLVSGIQPTGSLHIGNYLGAIKQWVALQHDYDCFFFIADYHALTARPNAKELHEAVLHVAASLVALGLDPKSNPLFVQSAVPEHAELACLLGNFTSLGQLNRMTQFKEKSDQHGQNAGLYTYPILMAADVLLYQTEAVPVGDDQIQHLELAREIVRSFNSHVKKSVFAEPKPLMTSGSRIMALNDPSKKMSKSLSGSTITILESEASLHQLIRRAVTDSDPNSSEMSAGVKNLFLLLEEFGATELTKEFQQKFSNGQLRYEELKEAVFETVRDFLQPVQRTYQSLRKDNQQLLKILEEGAKKARPIAQATLKEAKTSLGLLG